MRVFVSSLMSGHFVSLRESAAAGIRALGYEPVMAEDYAASPSSPQVACLDGVRSADAVVLILGSEYGRRQESGRSATHEEYIEARETARPVLAFIEDEDEPVTEQAEFTSEVQDWVQGQYTESFSGSTDLQAKVTRCLHRHAVAHAEVPLDADDLVGQARSCIPERSYSGQAQLILSIASGPSQPVLRPAALEDEEILRFLQSEALTGPAAVLDLASGTNSAIRGNAIIIEQSSSVASVSVSDSGSIVISQLATEHTSSPTVFPALIKEFLVERISRGLLLAGRVLDRVDPQQRIRHVAVAAAVLNAGYLSWSTREERGRNPHTATMNPFGQERVEVILSPPTRLRTALSSDTHRVAEDLVALLRRKAAESPFQ